MSGGIIVADILPLDLPVLVVVGLIGCPAFLSSVGARLLLNMKAAGEKGLNEGMGSSASRATVSGMDFAAPFAQRSDVPHEDEGESIGEIETIEA